VMSPPGSNSLTAAAQALSMKILVLHHIEPEWREFFNEEDLFRNLFIHLKRKHYDKIILATLTGIVYPELRPIITQEFEWDYYWEDPVAEEYRAWYEERGYNITDVIPVPTVHRWTYLYDWIKSLRGHRVTIAGGLRSECLRDLEEALAHTGVCFSRLESCCYG
jgi:hypothetical protein